MSSDMANIAGLNVLQSQLSTLADNWGGNESWEVSAPVDHAGPQEFGTARLPARPYFRPAIDQAVGNAHNLVRGVDTGDQFVQTIAHEIESDAARNAPVDTGELRNSITAEQQ
jgi:hypothetical protein